jgi:hypothetical protein
MNPAVVHAEITAIEDDTCTLLGTKSPFIRTSSPSPFGPRAALFCSVTVDLRVCRTVDI